MSEPSLRTPLVLPHQFYSSHTPPLRRFTDNRLRIRAINLDPGVSATFTSMTNRGTGLPNPEAAVVPALASAFDSEVTSLERVTARSAWVCAVLPDRHTLLDRNEISPYENRSSGYRSHTDIHCSAPSLQNLTGKPSLPIRLGLSWLSFSPPLGFADSRRSGHASVPSVARQQLPTPAALNELAAASPNPTDGILHHHELMNHPLCLSNYRQRSKPDSDCFADTALFMN